MIVLNSCLLIDATYIGTGTVCVSWITLFVSTMFAQAHGKSSTVARLPNETDSKWQSMHSAPSPTLSDILAAPQHSTYHRDNLTPTLPTIYSLAASDNHYSRGSQYYTTASSQAPASYYGYQGEAHYSPINNPQTNQYIPYPPTSGYLWCFLYFHLLFIIIY